MKTWEMIKALTENPELKFARVSDGVRFQTSDKIDSGEVIDHYITAVHSPLHECVRLGDEWGLVPEPVDFITAIKAYAEGKEITCKSEFGKRPYARQNLESQHLLDNNKLPITAQEILNGKWYIE